MILLLMVLQQQELSSLYISSLSYVTHCMSDGPPADTSYNYIITLCINIFLQYIANGPPGTISCIIVLTFCVNMFINIWLMVPPAPTFQMY